MHSTLYEYVRHRPRKRFGQHFLVDRPVIAAIVEAIRPQPEDRMLEIGPGLGALTRPLLALLDHLHVVEIDRDLVTRLQREFATERLTIYQADALEFDFGVLGPDLRVVGNLPYNISTPLLFHLADSAPAIRDIHVMLQKEVVERMVAAAGTTDYGRLSVMLQYRFTVEQVLTVPAEAFRPPPKVESAVVRLAPLTRQGTEQCDERLLAKLVARAFMQRRKTLRNALGDYLQERDFAALGIDPGARAEQLAVADFVRATRYLSSRGDA
ncbi:MAG: 16S rRNA (adenine(1518)-N(6)/adenine(1519)-N(6))-dimethyltransferase RsmA [Betaproteobacteria bacterium]